MAPFYRLGYARGHKAGDPASLRAVASLPPDKKAGFIGGFIAAPDRLVMLPREISVLLQGKDANAYAIFFSLCCLFSLSLSISGLI